MFEVIDTTETRIVGTATSRPMALAIRDAYERSTARSGHAHSVSVRLAFPINTVEVGR